MKELQNPTELVSSAANNTTPKVDYSEPTKEAATFGNSLTSQNEKKLDLAEIEQIVKENKVRLTVFIFKESTRVDLKFRYTGKT